jgi:hypothetical protein
MNWELNMWILQNEIIEGVLFHIMQNEIKQLCDIKYNNSNILELQVMCKQFISYCQQLMSN